MAFQPIVDVEAGRVIAYEALARGVNNEPAGWVLAQVTDRNRDAFDQCCRVLAIRMAERLGISGTGAMLSINFMPGAVGSPAACLDLTLKTAREVGFPLDRLMFEITEAEEVKNRAHLTGIVQEHRRHGFRIAIDDFGAGYSGMNLLADFRAEVLKLDMELTRNLHRRPAALLIVRSMVELCRALGTEVVAEGVETLEEYVALRGCGIRLMQGFLLAKPGFEALPTFYLPEVEWAVGGAGPEFPPVMAPAGCMTGPGMLAVH